MNSVERKHSGWRRLLGHEAVELFIAFVPLDGVKSSLLQIVVTLETSQVPGRYSLRYRDLYPSQSVNTYKQSFKLLLNCDISIHIILNNYITTICSVYQKYGYIVWLHRMKSIYIKMNRFFLGHAITSEPLDRFHSGFFLKFFITL